MQLSHLVQLGLFDFIFGPIATLLGWLTSLLYEFFGSFGLAIIFMTIIVQLIFAAFVNIAYHLLLQRNIPSTYNPMSFS